MGVNGTWIFSSTVINYCFWITKGIILDETWYCCPE